MIFNAITRLPIRFAVLVPLMAVAIVAANTCLSQEVERVWTSSNGKDTVHATLVDYQARKRKATLQLANGDRMDISTKKLSTKDRRYLRDYLKSKGDVTARELTSPTDRSKETQQLAQAITGRTTGDSRRNRRYGINWTTDIPAALTAARGTESVSDDRPVMWFRVLGDLTGFM